MKKLQCLLFTLTLIGSVAMAQKKVITGKVTNQATREAMPGVNILADKQKGGVVSRDDGSYSITVDPGSTQLIFSYVGFTTQSVLIGDKTAIDIALAPSTAS